MIRFILKADIDENEKLNLLLELQNEKQQTQELKLQLRDERQQIQNQKHEIELQLRDEKIKQETIYKLHYYQQLLTVRAVIENFDEDFEEKLGRDLAK